MSCADGKEGRLPPEMEEGGQRKGNRPKDPLLKGHHLKEPNNPDINNPEMILDIKDPKGGVLITLHSKEEHMKSNKELNIHPIPKDIIRGCQERIRVDKEITPKDIKPSSRVPLPKDETNKNTMIIEERSLTRREGEEGAQIQDTAKNRLEVHHRMQEKQGLGLQKQIIAPTVAGKYSQIQITAFSAVGAEQEMKGDPPKEMNKEEGIL